MTAQGATGSSRMRARVIAGLLMMSIAACAQTVEPPLPSGVVLLSGTVHTGCPGPTTSGSGCHPSAVAGASLVFRDPDTRYEFARTTSLDDGTWFVLLPPRKWQISADPVLNPEAFPSVEVDLTSGNSPAPIQLVFDRASSKPG